MQKLILLILGSIAIVAPANAQTREAPLSEIFESYNDCFAATESGSIDTEALESRGWARATIAGRNGDTINDGPIIYGHADRRPIIILSATEGEGVCVVNAQIESFDVFEKFTEAFGGRLPPQNDEGAIAFRAQGHVVQIAPTGSREQPSMRLVVATKAETN